MKKDMDKIIFESREEVANIQDVCEIFIDISQSAGEEKLRESARKLSALLDEMYLSW